MVQIYLYKRGQTPDSINKIEWSVNLHDGTQILTSQLCGSDQDLNTTLNKWIGNGFQLKFVNISQLRLIVNDPARPLKIHSPHFNANRVVGDLVEFSVDQLRNGIIVFDGTDEHQHKTVSAAHDLGGYTVQIHLFGEYPIEIVLKEHKACAQRFQKK